MPRAGSPRRTPPGKLSPRPTTWTWPVRRRVTSRDMPSTVRRDLSASLRLRRAPRAARGGFGSRFTRLSRPTRIACSPALESSDEMLLRGGFEGLKSLVFMGYYRDPRTWKILGYDGPVGRLGPRRGCAMISEGATLTGEITLDVRRGGGGHGRGRVDCASRAGARRARRRRARRGRAPHVRRFRSARRANARSSSSRRAADAPRTTSRSAFSKGAASAAARFTTPTSASARPTRSSTSWSAATVWPARRSRKCGRASRRIETRSLGQPNRRRAPQPRTTRRSRRGVEALGWRGGPLKHNRIGCQMSGFCELGCAYDAKQNALKVVFRRRSTKGARSTPTFAQRDHHRRRTRRRASSGRVRRGKKGVPRARSRSARRWSSSRRARSARRPSPSRAICPIRYAQIGRGAPHAPRRVVAGGFDRDPRQSPRHSAVVRVHRAPLVRRGQRQARMDRPGVRAPHRHGVDAARLRRGPHAAMRDYCRLAVLTAMVHDETEGQVASRRRPPEFALPDHRGRSRAARQGARRLRAHLFAAGAQEVVIPAIPPVRIRACGSSTRSIRASCAPRSRSPRCIRWERCAWARS